MALTNKHIQTLRMMGWAFYQYGPNEWQWMKFENGKQVAIQCDETWKSDMQEVLA